MVHNHTYIELLDDAQVFTVVEWITFFVALALHVSILPVANHLYRSGHTDEFPYWVYIVNFINAFGLALYSALSDCTIMLILNIIGMAVYTLCILIYIHVCRSKTWPMVKLLVTLLFSWGVYLHLGRAPREQHEDFLGTLTMMTTAVTLLPPLLHVNHFRRQQSCAGMPVAMSVFGFIACICWTVYGKLIDDPYTYLPNITGFIGSAVYLLMAVYYGFPEPHKHKAE